jgi:predicted  nucleic acid-binding Zn-ribbon protein
MIPQLASLIALQQLDTLAEAARRRLGEIPSAEQSFDARVTAAVQELDATKARSAANQHARRELEKQVAMVDSRLSRFEDHKAAVKTNQEFTALLHEIATAKGEKDSIEEQILVLLEEADGITADVKAAERGLADARRDAESGRAGLNAERQTLDAELARLNAERGREMVAVEKTVLARYEQLLKQRRMIAVAPIAGELCTACHVRLRPAVAQQVRRNEDIVTCDSCQRILYFVPKEPA